MTARRGRVVLPVLMVVLAALAGCASVPTSSPVQVLRRVGEGEGPALPPGPVGAPQKGTSSSRSERSVLPISGRSEPFCLPRFRNCTSSAMISVA